MRPKKNQILTSEISPKEYLSLSNDERKEICLEIIKISVKNLALIGGKELTQINMYKEILISTIKKYEEEEEYEACQMLNDMLEMVDEL